MANILIVYSNGITCILNKHFQIKNDGENQYLKNCLKKSISISKRIPRGISSICATMGRLHFYKEYF